MQHASRQARLSALAVAVIGALVVGNAAASGFQIRENSIKTLGRAFTGTTVAQDDATVAITNNSYLPCQLEHVWLRTTSDQTSRATAGPQTSSWSPVSTNLRDRLWLPGQRRDLQLRWTTSGTASSARLELGWASGRFPVRSDEAQMPAAVTDVELHE